MANKHLTAEANKNAHYEGKEYNTDLTVAEACGADVGGGAAGGPALAEGSEDAIAQADKARQKAMGRLEMYLDENGGIKDPARAGKHLLLACSCHFVL